MEENVEEKLYKQLIEAEDNYYDLYSGFRVLYYALKYMNCEGVDDIDCICDYADEIFEKFKDIV